MSEGAKKGEGPRSLALRVLLATERGRYLEPTLDLALEKSNLSRSDRGLAAQIAYGTMQRLYYLDHVLRPHLKDPSRLPAPARMILRAGSFEKLFLRTPDYAAVSEWVELAKAHAPRQAGLVNAVLRRVRHKEAPPWVYHSVPRFLYEHWEDFFGSAEFVRHFNEPAPLWVTALPGAEEVLKAEGVPFEPGPIPGSLKLKGVPIRKTRAYRKGLIQPQNPASLYAAQLLEAKPGELVLDLAGGAGIKAAWLAAMGARVKSFDKNPKRQAAGRENLKRLGVSVEFVAHDLTKPLPERAKKVLLDAPWTGTGTFRHHPELRYRIKPEDPKEMSRLQRRLLETAAQATLPGGVLVYSVCSLTADEGEEVVRDFLSRHPEFETLPVEPPFATLKKGLGTYTSPEAGLDGFYYAKLKKR